MNHSIVFEVAAVDNNASGFADVQLEIPDCTVVVGVPEEELSKAAAPYDGEVVGWVRLTGIELPDDDDSENDPVVVAVRNGATLQEALVAVKENVLLYATGVELLPDGPPKE